MTHRHNHATQIFFRKCVVKFIAQTFVLVVMVIVVVYTGMTIVDFIGGLITKSALNIFNGIFAQSDKIVQYWTYNSMKLAKLLNI